MSFALSQQIVNILNEHKSQNVIVFNILKATEQSRLEDCIPEVIIHPLYKKGLFKEKRQQLSFCHPNKDNLDINKVVFKKYLKRMLFCSIFLSVNF